MKSYASRRGVVLLVLVAIGWFGQPARAGDQPGDALPHVHDDGERFVAFYGHLGKPLSVLDTWRALRGIRAEIEKHGGVRKVAGLVYYAGDDLYLAAADFGVSEVFIDRVGKHQAFTLIWNQIEGDFRPGWSLRAPDRIQSTEPAQQL